MSASQSLRVRLRASGIRPRKSLGQSFLVDDTLAQRIVSFTGLQSNDTAIEIGPGVGALTRHLASHARQVIAIEIDRALIPILQEELVDCRNVSLVLADALEVDFAALLREQTGNERTSVHFVGNLPYYITSALVRKILESHLNVQSITLTVQLEVAERMVAQPGEMSLLSLSVQFYGWPQILMRINSTAFYPQPSVDSAVIRITPRPSSSYQLGPRTEPVEGQSEPIEGDLKSVVGHLEPVIGHPEPVEGSAGRAQGWAESPDANIVFALARAGFSQRRKQLRNTLTSGMRWSREETEMLLAKADINPTRRAETLSVEDWVRLSEVVREKAPSAVSDDR